MYKDGTLEKILLEKKKKLEQKVIEQKQKALIEKILASKEDKIQYIREFDPGSG